MKAPKPVLGAQAIGGNQALQAGTIQAAAQSWAYVSPAEILRRSIAGSCLIKRTQAICDAARQRSGTA
jgi:hypothetical protein